MAKFKTIFIVLMMTCMSLSGCFGETEGESPSEAISEFFAFADSLENRTWYHYPGGINAMNNTSALGGANIPFYASSSYYGI